MTDRRIHAWYIRPALERAERSRERSDSARNYEHAATAPDTMGDGSSPLADSRRRDEDPEIPGFRWTSSKPAPADAPTTYEGKPVSGEDTLRNLARLGLMNPAAVERVIRQKQEMDRKKQSGS